MQPSQPCPSRWPNPNVAASASENGPLGVMVKDPKDTALLLIDCLGPSSQEGLTIPGPPPVRGARRTCRLPRSSLGSDRSDGARLVVQVSPDGLLTAQRRW